MVRKTNALIQAALALLDQPDGPHWGYDLSRRTGVRSGVLYPILNRMLAANWVDSWWEDAGELEENRSPRRYYRLTPDGRGQLAALIDEARDDPRFSTLIADQQKTEGNKP